MAMARDGRRAAVVRAGDALVLDMRSLGVAGVIEIEANLRVIATIELSESTTITLDAATLRSLGPRVSIALFCRQRGVVHARSTLPDEPCLACAWLDVRVASRAAHRVALLVAACSSSAALECAAACSDRSNDGDATALSALAMAATVLSCLWAWRVGIARVRRWWYALVATALLASGASWMQRAPEDERPLHSSVESNLDPAPVVREVRRMLGSNGVSPIATLTDESAERFAPITDDVVAVAVRVTHGRGAVLHHNGGFGLRWELAAGAANVLIPWALLPIRRDAEWLSDGDSQIILAPREIVIHRLAPRWARVDARLNEPSPAPEREPMCSLGVSDWSRHSSLEIAYRTPGVRVFDDEQQGRAPGWDSTVGFARCPRDRSPTSNTVLVSRVWNVPATRALSIVADESSRATVGSWSPSERDDAHVWAVICHAVAGRGHDFWASAAWPASDEQTQRVRSIRVLVGSIGADGGPATRATLVPRRRGGRFDGFVLRIDETVAAPGR